MYYTTDLNKLYDTYDKMTVYLSTQAMIWIITNNLWGTDTQATVAQEFFDVGLTSAVDMSYRELLKGIQTSYNNKIPSFASKSADEATVYELTWNEDNQRYEYTFTDTNESLSNYDFSASGYGVSKDGNSLTIYTDTANTDDTVGTFTATNGAVDITSGCTYWTAEDDSISEMVTGKPTAETAKAYVKFKTKDTGYAAVNVTDKSSSNPIEGAVYTLYSDNDCTTEVATLTTDAEGNAKTEALPAGTYYLKATQVPDGYTLPDTVNELTIAVGATSSISDTLSIVEIAPDNDGGDLDGSVANEISKTLNKTTATAEKATDSQAETGDNFNPWILIVIAMAALLVATGTILYRRKSAAK
jgi:LPXTG-motif cell wall-anchored protein